MPSRNPLIPRDILKLLKDNQFRLVREKKHYIFKHPCGRTVAVSGTPCDPNARKQCRREIERIVKEIDAKRRDKPEETLRG